MGFIPFSYYQETKDQVKGIAIDDGEGCVDPTPENVLGLTYTPLGRGLFTYFSDVALAKPETVAFGQFVLDNAIEIAELSDYVPDDHRADRGPAREAARARRQLTR